MVDEQIMKFSGRVDFLQYNVQKPVCRGLKLWVWCDTDSAYCLEFEIYLGAGSSVHSKNGALFDVVWDIVKSIQGKNHCVYFDNYYSSVALARFLYSKQIYSCATIQKGRKLLPEKIKHPGKIVHGKSICFQSTRLKSYCNCLARYKRCQVPEHFEQTWHHYKMLSSSWSQKS